jgi:hypothetical protein
VYREVYRPGLTDAQQAKVIIDNSPYTEATTITYADPVSYWIRKNKNGVVYTSADEYLDQGVPLWEADNDRKSGKRKIETLLADLPDGEPGLKVFEGCHNLIRMMPKLARSENDPEDVDTDQEDHAYDALRYGLTNPKMFTKSRKRKQAKNPMMGVRGL